jgi:MFS family permease
MSAVAEPIQHILHDDKLARRNAIVLAVAQALAGGNNTVIVSTASIVGAVLAPDKGLATLPVTTMVFGMWLGTLPLGVLARHFGRRFALQCGSVFGILSGLISYAAVMNGSFWLLLVGTFCGGLYAAAHQSYRFAAADTASDAYRPKVVSWVLAGGVFAAVLGPQLVIFTKDLLSPHLFAASYLGQSVCALAAAIVLQFVKVPPLGPVPHNGARPLGEIVRSARFIVAVACGIASYGMMNMVMTSAPLAMVGCGHFGDRCSTRHSVARDRDVCAKLRHRRVDCALWRRAHHGRRPGIDCRDRRGRDLRNYRGAFLDRAGAARARMEPVLHRRDHHGDAVPSAVRAQQGSGV